jgi:hypothetical protein
VQRDPLVVDRGPGRQLGLAAISIGEIILDDDGRRTSSDIRSSILDAPLVGSLKITHCGC